MNATSTTDFAAPVRMMAEEQEWTLLGDVTGSNGKTLMYGKGDRELVVMINDQGRIDRTIITRYRERDVAREHLHGSLPAGSGRIEILLGWERMRPAELLFETLRTISNY